MLFWIWKATLWGACGSVAAPHHGYSSSNSLVQGLCMVAVAAAAKAVETG